MSLRSAFFGDGCLVGISLSPTPVLLVHLDDWEDAVAFHDGAGTISISLLEATTLFPPARLEVLNPIKAIILS